MNLVIDIGNTLCKLALFDKNEIIKFEAFSDISVTDFSNFIESHNIDNCICASVVQTPSFIENFCNKKGIRFDHQTALPIINKYETPQTLGLDRLALAVAGYKKAPNQNVLVISAGTCITYDFINEKGEYIGGAISPGLNMRAKALNQYTEKLPLIDLKDIPDTFSASEFGTSTGLSIQNGILYGARAEINQRINWFTDTYKNYSIFLTGGDHFYFVNSIKITIFAFPNMVLTGLNDILNYNTTDA